MLYLVWILCFVVIMYCEIVEINELSVYQFMAETDCKHSIHTNTNTQLVIDINYLFNHLCTHKYTEKQLKLQLVVDINHIFNYLCTHTYTN